MGSEHQKFKKGQKKLSAKQLNAISRDAEVAGKTRVRGGRQVRMPGVGQSIDTTVAATREVLDFDKSMTVVIKKSPSTNAGWVTVQRVQYIDWPVQPCTDTGCRIQVFGNTIEARPQFGMKADGYSSYEVEETIDTDTVFFSIRWENRQWILSAPAAGGGENRIGIITAAAGPGQFVTFQEVQESETGFTAVGSSEQVKVWPGSVASDFTQHVTSAGVTDGPYVMLVMHRGTEYAMQTMVFYTFAPTGTVTAGDCA